MKPETAQARARDLERRLEKRLADLDRDEELIARPPAISAAALVVPQGLLNQLLGDPEPARLLPARRHRPRPTGAPSPPSSPPNARLGREPTRDAA